MKSNIFNFWNLKSNTHHNNIRNWILNFGPQHPAAHGVLRLILQLQNEIVERADPHIGFLHRGTEKLIESKLYLQALPYFDRLDYVSMMTQEHAFCLSVETLLKTSNYTSLYIKIRVLFDELTRLLNHFLTISTHSLDVGNMSPLFWAFEERERIMEFYERVSGARMHAAFYRPNTLDMSGISMNLLIDITLFTRDCFKALTEIYTTLSFNRLWKARLVNIGRLSYEKALTFGATGVIARAAGIKRDLRLNFNDTYAAYWLITFQSFIGTRGDSFDRFLIRIREMFESMYIIFQIIKLIYNDKGCTFYPIHNKTPQTKYTNMETLINHFKYYSEGLVPEKNITYQAVEAPKGEFGVTLVSDNSNYPFRCKIKTPAYTHLQLLSVLSKGHFFADIVTLIGSQDIVFGEVDR